MNILIINRYSEIHGGADTVFLNTVKLLTVNGHQVYTFTLDDLNLGVKHRNFYKTQNKTLLSKFSVFRNYIYHFEVALKLVSFLKKNNIDVCNIHLYIGSLSNSIIHVLKLFKVPIVHTVHDYRLICPANAMFRDNTICEKCLDGSIFNSVKNKCSKGKLFQSLTIWFEALIRNNLVTPSKKIDHFLFVSHFSRAIHESKFPSIKGKGTVIYNFSNQEKLSKNHSNYFLFFGRLSQEKGIINLLKVIESYNIPLKIAGDGPLKGIVEKFAEKNSCITYEGKKNKQELQELIENCKFVVLPSVWYENNPMTIIESFHIGKPVIGSDLGGIPELIGTDKGLIFRNDAKNINLLNALVKANSMSDQEYLGMSKKCFNYARKVLSEKINYSKLIQVLDHVSQ